MLACLFVVAQILLYCFTCGIHGLKYLRKAAFIFFFRPGHMNITASKYSQSSRKQPPQEFWKVVATRAGCLQEWALVSNQVIKHYFEGGCLQELLAESLMVTYGIVVIINSFWLQLPIIEDVCVCTSQQTISWNQSRSESFYWNVDWVVTYMKWSWLLMGAVAYESF